MTIRTAEHILDLVSAALQDESHPGQHPISALGGYDLFDVVTALQLRVANEFLHLVRRPDFEQQFSEGLKLYDGIPWQIMQSFVADSELGQIGAKAVLSAIDPKTMKLDTRFASLETASSFGDFCKSLGADDLNYWGHVYGRSGIEYTPESPRANVPATPTPNHTSEVVSQAF